MFWEVKIINFMGEFDCPSVEVWQKRQDWIAHELETAETGLVYLCSDHAIALFMDMQLAFCVGAWLSVIIISISVIDSHLRQTEAMDERVGTAKLLDEYYVGDDITWLRQLRNRYVHVNPEHQSLEMNYWFDNKVQMEEHATKAMKMTIRALFQNPGI